MHFNLIILLLMANVFFNFWRIGSFILLSVVLMFCYTTLPENIAIGFAENGQPVKFIDKQSFFYWSCAIILGINFLVGILSGFIAKVDFRKIYKSAQSPQAINSVFKGWFSALLAFVNTYLVFVLLGLYNINSREDQSLDFNYNYLLWIGVLGLAIILIFLPFKLLRLQAPNEDF